MTTEITTYTPQQKELLLSTVCKGVDTNDFLFMLELAKKYQLDPFAHQIYATKVGIIISRDGYLSIAHRHPQFDGIQTEFEDDENGNPVKATTTVWRKDWSHPIVESAYWNDVHKDTDVWKKYRHDMLQKCSERKALTRAFCITGLYTDAELDCNPVPERIVDEECIDVEPIQVEPKPARKVPVHKYGELEVRKICDTYTEHGWPTDVIEKARFDADIWDKDMIQADYKQRLDAEKAQAKTEPAPVCPVCGRPGMTVDEAHHLECLADTKEFDHRMCRDCAAKWYKDRHPEEIVQEEPSRQTKPSAALSGDVCEKCGCKLMESEANVSKQFCDGHLFCETHRYSYVQEKMDAKNHA